MLRFELSLATAALIAMGSCCVAQTSAGGTHLVPPAGRSVPAAGAARAPTVAPGGEDGGAGGQGKVGDPYSQAGYGKGAFGNGLPSPKR